MRKVIAGVMGCVLLFVLSAENAARAQTYPSRPIRFVIPFPPGGGADASSRIIGQALGERLGHTVVIDNRGGAGGIIGTDTIAKAPPDGYTIGFIVSSHAVNPALYKSLPYDSVKDFAPVTQLSQGVYVVVAHPSVPAKSINELIAYAKAQPGKVNVAIAALGTPSHIAMEQFKLMFGLDIVGVPYKGGGPAISDLLGGQVQLLFASLPSVRTYITAGRLRALCVLSAKRSTIAPDVPTAVESGHEGLVIGGWYGIVTPARTDKAIVARLNDEIVKLLATRDVKDRMLGLGEEIVGSTPQEFGAFIQAEILRWGKLVRQAGIKLE